MSLEDLRALDAEQVAARCGGSSTAEDGPNTGNAGEQEAPVADTEYTDGEDASRDVPAVEIGDSPATEDGADEQTPSDEVRTGARRVQMHATPLVEQLMAADSSLDQPSALKLLETLLNEGRVAAGRLPTILKSGSQFVPDSLAADVDVYITEHYPPVWPADEGDDAGTPASPASDQLDTDQAASSVLDEYREALRPYLAEAVTVWRRSGEHAAASAILELANAFWAQGLLFYASLGVKQSEAQTYLLRLRFQQGQPSRSLTLEALAEDHTKRRQAWYYRVAHRSVVLVLEGKSLEESLLDFTWPSEGQLRKLARRRDSEHQPGIAPLDPIAQSQEDAPDAESTEMGSSPISVEKVDGRRVVTSGELPFRSEHIVTGGGPKMKPPFKRGGVISGPAQDRHDVEPGLGAPNADASAHSVQQWSAVDEDMSDADFLASLPDDVVRSAIQSVINDPDPVACWRYRSPRSIRYEADFRLLQEYRPVSAA